MPISGVSRAEADWFERAEGWFSKHAQHVHGPMHSGWMPAGGGLERGVASLPGDGMEPMLDRIADIIAGRVLEQLNAARSEDSGESLDPGHEIISASGAAEYIRLDDVASLFGLGTAALSDSGVAQPSDMGHDTMREPVEFGGALAHGLVGRAPYEVEGDDAATARSASGAGDFIYAPSPGPAPDGFGWAAIAEVDLLQATQSTASLEPDSILSAYDQDFISFDDEPFSVFHDDGLINLA